jgi:protein-disulfide isomerase
VAVWCALAALAGLTLAGCGRNDETRVPASAPLAAPSSTVAPARATPLAPDGAGEVVARVGGEPVRGRELDQSIALRLYDLERARYELRAARLRELLLARVFGPAAAAEHLPVDAYVRRQAAAAGSSEAALVGAAFAHAGVETLLEPPAPPVVAVSSDDDAIRGPADAPIAIVVFCDFQSPYCRDQQPVLRRLLAAYPTQVRLAVRDFPLPMHRDAAGAAEAAECAGEQDAYWPYHDVLFQERADLSRAALPGYAQRVGIDVARFEACVDERRQRDEVAADAAEARRLGLGIVPTIFVDGRYLRGPQPYEVLRAEIDAALVRRGLTVPTPAAPASPPAAPAAAPQPASTPPRSASAPTPESSIALPAALVADALSRRGELERDLEHPVYDGGPGTERQTVVRVGTVRPGSLYAAMGFQPGDVVASVDGTLLVGGSDALFEALAAGAPVVVQVLRHGLPHTYEYRVE